MFSFEALGAFSANQRGADMLTSPFFRDDPRPQRPRRPMAHMLRMAAGKIRNPILVFILVEANYF
jgi:hypothetical protein